METTRTQTQTQTPQESKSPGSEVSQQINHFDDQKHEHAHAHAHASVTKDIHDFKVNTITVNTSPSKSASRVNDKGASATPTTVDTGTHGSLASTSMENTKCPGERDGGGDFFDGLDDDVSSMSGSDDDDGNDDVDDNDDERSRSSSRSRGNHLIHCYTTPVEALKRVSASAAVPASVPTSNPIDDSVLDPKVENDEISSSSTANSADDTFSSTSTIIIPRLQSVPHKEQNALPIDANGLVKSELIDTGSDDELMRSNLSSCNSISSAHHAIVDVDVDAIDTNIGVTLTEVQRSELIIKSQRKEIMRFNDLLKNYRESVKEKNSSIRSLDKDLSDLRLQQGCRASKGKENTHGNDINMDRPGLDQNGESKIIDTSETISSMERNEVESELRVQQQIIRSLTDENNAFRARDATHLSKISQLQLDSKNIAALTEARISHKAAIHELTTEIEMKNDMLSSVLQQNATLKEDYSGCQVQIADLGQEVIRFEKELNAVRNENETLQKMLSTSREAVLNRSLETNINVSVDHSAADIYTGDDSNCEFRNMASDDSMEDAACLVKDATCRPASASASASASEAVVKSLMEELEATKSRERELRDQMMSMLDDNDTLNQNHSDSKDSIMEKLSESQQEAIIYLNSEVSDLRDQLEVESKKMVSQVESSKSEKEKNWVLEYENRLTVEKLLESEKTLESAVADLSIKLGENACMRDEIRELEEKARTIENHLVNVQKECRELRDFKEATDSRNAMAEVPVITNTIGTQTQVSAMVGPKDEDNSHSKQLNADVSSQMDDATLMTVEIHPDGIETAFLSQGPTPSDHRQFSVLKKALKAKYEKKQIQLEAALEMKDIKKKKLEETLEIKQEELIHTEVRRISNEAEMHEELETLRMSLKECSLELIASKEKMKKFRDTKASTGSSQTWKNVSDALIDGVGASIEMFESLSFMSDEEKKDENKEGQHSNHPPRIISAKSYG